MNKITLKKKQKTGLMENSQSVDLQFAFVNKNYEQLTTSFKCRDFMGDFLWSRVNNSIANIYGFQYNFKENPYDTECFRVSLEFPDTKVKDLFLSNLPYLHKKEEEAGTSLCKLLETQEENVYVLEGDPIWQSTVWKTSLYTFYMKVMCYPSIKKVSHPESSYIVHLTEEKEKLLLSKVKTSEYFNRDSIDLNHNHSGFVALLCKNDYKFDFISTSQWKSYIDETNFIFGSLT